MKFYYKFKSEPYAYGPCEAKNEKEFREHLRKLWDLKTLHTVELWRV